MESDLVKEVKEEEVEVEEVEEEGGGDPSDTIVKMKVSFENHHRKCICYSFISLTSRTIC